MWYSEIILSKSYTWFSMWENVMLGLYFYRFCNVLLCDLVSSESAYLF
jgi:hypothetical protein